MSDLISRPWMMEQLDGLGDTRLIKRNFIALVTNAPTIDAVPVVRCCECRHAVKIGKYGCYCRNNSTPWFNGEFEVYMDKDDFCSYGERKEGADNG